MISLQFKRQRQIYKKTNNWNEIISKNRELLFSFCKAPEDEDKKRSIKIDTEKFPAFAENINALRKKENNEEANKKEDDSKRFRIAILKADLDRMGAMFKNIKDYKKYRNISQNT